MRVLVHYCLECVLLQFPSFLKCPFFLIYLQHTVFKEFAECVFLRLQNELSRGLGQAEQNWSRFGSDWEMNGTWGRWVGQESQVVLIWSNIVRLGRRVIRGALVYETQLPSCSHDLVFLTKLVQDLIGVLARSRGLEAHNFCIMWVLNC